MELPDHPRVREIEAERRRRPIGINCAINILRNGARHVIPGPNADPNGKGSRRNFPYFGSVPFQVHRAKGKPDTVQVSLLDEASVINPFDGGGEDTLLQFGFAMHFFWEFSDDGGVTWYPDGTPPAYWQPFSNNGSVRWGDGDGLDVNGSNLATNGVPLVANTPIRPLADYPTDPAWEAGYLFSSSTDWGWRITSVRFFFGNTMDGGLTFTPNIAGTWNIVFDEREDDGFGLPDTGSIVATHTIGPFGMSQSDEWATPTTWPTISPGLSWAVLASNPQKWFNGLRIVRVS